MNHVISLEDILGPELAIQAEQNKQFKRLNAIQAGLEAGIPFDMSALSAELGIGSGLNRAMESFYMGDAPKKTMTIALEEVGVVKAGLIAAGIGVLAVILKKIYDWIKNFFGGSSGGGGGGGGGSSSGSSSGSAEQVFEAAKDAKDVAKDLNDLSHEVKALPEVVVAALNNAVPKDSAEAEKVHSEQTIPFAKALTTTPGTDEKLLIPTRVKAKKKTYTGDTSKLKLAEVNEGNAIDELPSDEQEDVVKSMNIVLKWCKERKVIYVSNASNVYASILSDKAQPMLHQYAYAVKSALQIINEVCAQYKQSGMDDIISANSARSMLGLDNGEKHEKVLLGLISAWEKIESHVTQFTDADTKTDAALASFSEFVNSNACPPLEINKKLQNSSSVMNCINLITSEFNSENRLNFQRITEDVYKYSEKLSKSVGDERYNTEADAKTKEGVEALKTVLSALTGFIKAVCKNMRQMIIYIRKMCRAVFSVVADVVGVTNMMVDKNLLTKHDMTTINKMDRTIEKISGFMEKIDFSGSLRKVQHA